MKPTLLAHRKFRALLHLTGMNTRDAVGTLELLWLMTAQHDTGWLDGELTGLDGASIELACEWHGEQGKLCAALVSAGFLTLACDIYTVKNWREHRPRYLDDRERNKNKCAREPSRKLAEKPRNSAKAHKDSAPSASPPLPSLPEESSDGASAPSAVGDADASTPARAARGGRRSAPKITWSEEAGFEGIRDADRARWEKAYPSLTIERQLAAMHDWLIANPREAPKSNYGRFITGWLSRNQDRGGDARSDRRATTTPADTRPDWKREQTEKAASVRADTEKLIAGMSSTGSRTKHPDPPPLRIAGINY